MIEENVRLIADRFLWDCASMRPPHPPAKFYKTIFATLKMCSIQAPAPIGAKL
jgi:hypothetical protein